MKIPIYSWGGHPIKVISSGEGIEKSDINAFRNWSKIISDPANREEWLSWVSEGKCWLEGPSADFKRRLLLWPFFERRDGARGHWNFWGFVFPTESLTPDAWASSLHYLVNLEQNQLKMAGDSLEIPDSEPINTRSNGVSPIGQVFGGPYPDALRQLVDAISGWKWNDLRGLSIACHPPTSLTNFSSLIRSEGFPLQKVGLVAASNPSSKKASGSETPPFSSRSSLSSFLMRRSTLGVSAFIVGFFLGTALNKFRAENRSLRDQIEKLTLENRVLREIAEPPLSPSLR